MNLVSIRVITADIAPLVTFYEKITGMTVIKYTDDFAELRTANATLAIGSTRTMAFFGETPIAEPAQNRSVIIEFMVEDVDAAYLALADFLQGKIVQAPTTMPWGNRSLLFRDPDGNLVNFFTPLTAAAKQRLTNQGAE